MTKYTLLLHVRLKKHQKIISLSSIFTQINIPLLIGSVIKSNLGSTNDPCIHDLTETIMQEIATYIVLVSKKNKKTNDISLDTIMIIATIIIVLATIVFITIVTQSLLPFMITIIAGIIILVVKTPSITPPSSTKPNKLQSPFYTKTEPIPLMDREPKSVVELWVIGIIITAVFGFICIILGVVSGFLFGIAILVRIDSINKLLRRQIKDKITNT